MAQTLYDTTSSFTQSTIAPEHTSTEFFETDNFGFVRLASREQHGATWYPTPDYLIDAGWFTLDPVNNTNFGDFNGDGLVDLILNPMLFVHMVGHPETLLEPIMLIQDGNGSFIDPKVVSESSDFVNLHQPYRTDVGDFNGDGFDDFAVAASGLVARIDDVMASTIAELPYVGFGNNTIAITSSQSFSGLTADQYGYGHALVVGDFNGDGFDDFASNRTVFTSNGDNTFTTTSFESSAEKYALHMVLSMASSDFNNDGYDDLVYSPFIHIGDFDNNGADLYLLLGNQDGLKDGQDAITISNPNAYTDYDDNRIINFIHDLDINGDGNRDFILLEHLTTKDDGDASNYYTKGFLRLYVGNGDGSFTESPDLIMDNYYQTRQGEGNIHILDVNGDGWDDVVLANYTTTTKDWGPRISEEGPSTTIFINRQGVLEKVDESVFAYLDPYQFAGSENLKEWQTKQIEEMIPVDLGNDGMIDFVSFVPTPRKFWPQIEPVYNYGYVVRAKKPLGREEINERLEGTANNDRIFGYDGKDIISGGRGDDKLNGGNQVDTAVYSNVFSEYTITSNTDTLIVLDSVVGRDGSDTLTSIERLQFSNISLALDIEGANSAGGIYRTYKAAFNRTPEKTGFGYWIDRADNGASAVQMAEEFVWSAEFQTLYGVTTSDNYLVGNDIEAVVDLFYRNVLGRAPDQGGLTYYTSTIEDQNKTGGQVLTEIADSAENRANLLSTIETGMSYDLWLG